MKRSWQRIGNSLALAVTLGLLALIFFFSAQPGARSYAVSQQVTSQVENSALAKAVTPAFFSGNFHANVRKWAHVYLYCALGVSMAVTVHRFGAGRLGWPGKALTAAAFCTAAAAGDELHQWFVPGRAALLSDVGVDAMGFVPCILATLLLLWLAQRRFDGRREIS